jgi:hypothetical protein
MDTQFGIVPRESFISLSKASKLGFFFFFTFIILNKKKNQNISWWLGFLREEMRLEIICERDKHMFLVWWLPLLYNLLIYLKPTNFMIFFLVPWFLKKTKFLFWPHFSYFTL